MRFSRVYLRAYGRFTDRVLELHRTGGSDLHLLFGPNEAGKSTVLEGVTDFLFGFGHRTDLDFKHAQQDLRIGASIELAAGRTLHAMRRKGRKQTLFPVDPDTLREDTSKPLADDSLHPVLSGLDRDTYRMLFGLDLEALIEGGEALLAGEGEVGQSLFQAAAGLASLKGLVDELREEAEALFTARASKPALNASLREFVEQGRALREATVRSTQWESADSALHNAVQAHKQKREALRAAQAERTRLERIRSNLPLLARRVELLGALAPLAPVPRLAADAGERRAKVEERLRVAGAAVEGAAAELARLVRARESIVVRTELLAQTSVIERLYRQADACVAARDEVARQLGAQQAAQGRVLHLLTGMGLGVEPAGALAALPTRTRVTRVRALGTQHAEITSKLNALADQLDGARAAAARDETSVAGLPAPVDVDALTPALAELAAAPQTEQRLRETETQVTADEVTILRLANELGHTDPAPLSAMALPARATVADFQRRFDTLDRRAGEQDTEADKLVRDLEARRVELRGLEAAGEVVTQSQVQSARARRDAGWTLVRRLHVENDTTATAAASDFAGDVTLADAVEAAIREADRVADLLHADVKRATRYAAIAQRIDEMEAARARIAGERAALGAEQAELMQRWLRVRDPLGVGDVTPGAVLEWMQKQQTFASAYEQLAGRRRSLATLIGERDGLVRTLNDALAACQLSTRGENERVAAALQRLQRFATAATKAAAERESLTTRLGDGARQLRQFEESHRRMQEALERWKLDWTAAVAGLGLAPDSLPEEVDTRLAQFEALREALDEVQTANRALSEQRALIAGFEDGVRQLVAVVGDATDDRPAEVVARELYEAMQKARAAAQRLAELTENMVREQQRRDQADRDLRAARTEMAALVRAAGCVEPSTLPSIEEQSARRRTLEENLAQTDATLIQQNSRPVAEIFAEAAAFDLDGVTQALADVEYGIDALDTEVRMAQESESNARRAFEAIDGSARAAELQQSQATLAAGIRAQAQHWARVRLASAVLHQVVQQYRERHQGPLLARACVIFATITRGSFASLATDYLHDTQVLLGLRPDGGRVTVAGMSKGTRDQLFLALRLATIEAHLASRGPFPVIVDDLLVQFDDERALATLEVLAALGRDTQVLFFTHHRHLVELAEREGVVNASTIHQLS